MHILYETHQPLAQVRNVIAHTYLPLATAHLCTFDSNRGVKPSWERLDEFKYMGFLARALHLFLCDAVIDPKADVFGESSLQAVVSNLKHKDANERGPTS